MNAPVPDPSLTTCHIDEPAGMDPAVNRECVFCQIVAGLAPGKIVKDWDDTIALVPLTPVVEGHVLIIPKRHVAHAAEDVEITARTMARAAEHARGHDSFNLITSAGRAATQSIDHLHVHVVPRAADDQLMTPWGTIYGDDPTAPHWCRQAQELAATPAAHPATPTVPATPPVDAGSSEGANGAQTGAGELGLGDALRHLAAGAADMGDMPFTVVLLGQLADRADALEAAMEKTSRGAQTLGQIIEQQSRDVLDATGMHHVIDETGDGDWQVVWERMSELCEKGKRVDVDGELGWAKRERDSALAEVEAANGRTHAMQDEANRLRDRLASLGADRNALALRLDRLSVESVRRALDSDDHRPGWTSAAISRVLAIVDDPEPVLNAGDEEAGQ